MGLTQPPTNIQIDNTTAEAFPKGTLKQKLSKSVDMHFYWLQDRETQGLFDIFWRTGKDNLSD